MMTDARTRYAALLEVSESIVSHQSLPALIHALSHSLVRLVPFAGLGLVLHDPERRVGRLYHLESALPHRIPAEHEFSAEESPTSIVLETGQPFYFADLESDTRFPVLVRMLL